MSSDTIIKQSQANNFVDNPIVIFYAVEVAQEMTACQCDDCDPCDYEAKG